MISVRFQGKPFNITVIQVYAPTSNTEEAEVEWFYEHTAPTVSCAVLCVMLSRVQLFSTPWIVACQAPLSMGLSRQEYWSGVPFPPPGDLPDPGFKSPALAGRFFTTGAT